MQSAEERDRPSLQESKPRPGNDQRHRELKNLIERRQLREVADLSWTTDVSGRGQQVILQDRAHQSRAAEAEWLCLQKTQQLIRRDRLIRPNQGPDPALALEPEPLALGTILMEEEQRRSRPDMHLRREARSCQSLDPFEERT